MRIAYREHLNAVKLASVDSTRYVLNGVLLEETEKGLRAVATDGRRMAVVESTGGLVPEDFPQVPGMDVQPNSETRAILPRDAVLKVLKSLPKKAKLPILNTALVKLGKTQSTVCTSDLAQGNVMPSGNIEGNYPNWHQVLPKTDPTLFIGMDTELLIETLQLALANGARTVKLEFWDASSPMRIEFEKKEIKTTLIQMPMRP